MTSVKRGEVWWAQWDPPIGRRPTVLLSRDAAYPVRLSITVAPVTTRIRGIGTEVRLGPGDGLSRPCVVNLDDIDTIPKARVLDYIATLTPQRMLAVEAAIRYALGFQT